MAVLNIPLTALALGGHSFGPVPVADADSVAALSIDRTVTGGLAVTPATVIVIEVQLSWPGHPMAFWTSATVPGGVLSFISSKTGQTVIINTSNVTVGLPAVTSRQAQAQITVAGAAVAVQGSLTLS